jgi:hypothetical protein
LLPFFLTIFPSVNIALEFFIISLLFTTYLFLFSLYSWGLTPCLSCCTSVFVMHVVSLRFHVPPFIMFVFLPVC